MKKAADVIKESIRKILGIMVHDLKKIFTHSSHCGSGRIDSAFTVRLV